MTTKVARLMPSSSDAGSSDDVVDTGTAIPYKTPRVRFEIELQPPAGHHFVSVHSPSAISLLNALKADKALSAISGRLKRIVTDHNAESDESDNREGKMRTTTPTSVPQANFCYVFFGAEECVLQPDPAWILLGGMTAVTTTTTTR